MSPRTQEAYQVIRDERQEQILKAALNCFASQGFSAAKITDIAAAAGVSYGLVDHYFGKKEELYTAAVERAYRGALDLLEAALRLPLSPWEQLRFICAEMLDGVQKSPDYVLLVNQAKSEPAIPEESRATFRVYEERSLDIQADLIRRGQAAGEIIAGDPVELVMAFTAVIQGLAVQWMDVGSREEFRPHFPSPETVLRILKA